MSIHFLAQRNPELYKQIIRLLKQGMLYKEIAEKVGIPPQTISYINIKAGLKRIGGAKAKPQKRC
jgi:hypothetical protein